MQVQRILTTIVTLTLVAVRVAAQGTTVVVPDGESPTAIAERAPDRVVELPAFVRIEDLKVSESSGDAVAQVSYRRLNLWPVLVHYWPELVIAALSLLAIVAIIRAAREGRQLIGVPYCRQCGYHLQGLPSATRCPECGGSVNKKTKRVRQRFRKRRVAWIVALVATPVSLVWFRGSLPRQLDAKSWFDWPSETAFRLVAKHLRDTAFASNALPHASVEFAFIRLDPVSGRFDSTRHAPGTERVVAWAVSRDGARLAGIPRMSGDGFVWDIAARREWRRFEVAQDSPRSDIEIGFSADGGSIWCIGSSPFIQRIDATTGRVLERRDVSGVTTRGLFWSAELVGSRDFLLSQPMGRHVLIDLTSGEWFGPQVDGGRLLLTADHEHLVWCANRLDAAPVLRSRWDRLSGEAMFHIRDFAEFPATTSDKYWIDAIALDPPVAFISSHPSTARQGNFSMYLLRFGPDQSAVLLIPASGGERTGVIAPDSSWGMLWGNQSAHPDHGVIEIFDLSTAN
ncbi:MAG: hypothetical protein ACF8PN_03405 [Phycisphaerales bacterium]